MRIGVDIDGVLYDFADGLRSFLEQKYPTLPAMSLPEPTRWEFYLDWGFTEEEFIALCHEAVDKRELFWKGTPFPGTARALRRLVDAGHEVILITNRFFGTAPGISEEATKRWLFDRGFEYHELHFASDKTTFSVDFHIDDNVGNYLAMDGAGVKSYLLDRPWNQDAPVTKRVMSLDEYVNVVLNNTADTEAVYDYQRANGSIRAVSSVAQGGMLGTMTDPYRKSDEVTVTSETGGQKGQKLARYDLIPPAALRQVAELYGKGAEKYDDHNWRRGYAWSLSFAAMNRHLWQFWNGEEYDSETGCAHLTSVIFHAMTLLTFMEEQRGYDDRFATSRSEGLKVVSEGDSPPCPCEPVSGQAVASEEGSETLFTDILTKVCPCYKCQHVRDCR